jgi:hypothetical protein
MKPRDPGTGWLYRPNGVNIWKNPAPLPASSDMYLTICLGFGFGATTIYKPLLFR